VHPRSWAAHSGANPGFRADVAVSSAGLTRHRDFPIVYGETGNRQLSNAIVVRFQTQFLEFEIHETHGPKREVLRPGLDRRWRSSVSIRRFRPMLVRRPMPDWITVHS
jgi:hypothetical protein